jgi:hypothetical protein
MSPPRMRCGDEETLSKGMVGFASLYQPYVSMPLS